MAQFKTAAILEVGENGFNVMVDSTFIPVVLGYFARADGWTRELLQEAIDKLR